MQAWEEIELARKDGRKDGKIEAIKMIMKNTKSTVDEAMDILEIPVDEREMYISML